jgi:hypothetical protein
MSVLGFELVFPDDDSCWAFLESVRWPVGTVCPKCDSVADAVPWRARSHRWHCRFCGARFHAGQGTILEGSHLSLRTWFLAIHLLDEQTNMSSVELGRQLDIRQKTAWDLARRLRAMAKEDGPLLRAIADASTGRRASRRQRGPKKASVAAGGNTFAGSRQCGATQKSCSKPPSF